MIEHYKFSLYLGAKWLYTITFLVRTWTQPLRGFSGGSVIKNLPANAGDVRLIFGSGRSIGGGNGNPLQYSCLQNSMDRGAWQDTVHGVTKEPDTTEQLNNILLGATMKVHTSSPWQVLLINHSLLSSWAWIWPQDPSQHCCPSAIIRPSELIPIVNPLRSQPDLCYFLFQDFFFSFLLWPIFKVFIEFVTILLLFYVLAFWPQDI